MIQVGNMFLQANDDDAICKYWLILDTATTCNAVCNPDVLKNIINVPKDEFLELRSDGGM